MSDRILRLDPMTLPTKSSVEERYENDTAFHAVVDMLHAVIARADLSPYEVRQAAMLAAIRYEMRNMRVLEELRIPLHEKIPMLAADHGMNAPLYSPAMMMRVVASVEGARADVVTLPNVEATDGVDTVIVDEVMDHGSLSAHREGDAIGWWSFAPTRATLHQRAPGAARRELELLRVEEDRIAARKAAIYQASLAAPEEEKVCADRMAEMLAEREPKFEYPIHVSAIACDASKAIEPSILGRNRKVGAFVAIRPCDPECAGRTYLGVYLGDIATGVSARFHKEPGILHIGFGHHNPAIWVPDLARVVFGMESWWSVLKTPEDLKQITDVDIQDIWYVRALKNMSEPGEGKPTG